MLIDRTHKKWFVAFLVALAVSTALYVPYARDAPHGPTGGSVPGLAYGIVGFALMIFAGLLGARKKVRIWRLGRAQAWMRGHLWLGLLSYPLILYHAGFAMRGTLTLVLMVLFTIVIVSGIVGAVFQHYIPRLMTAQVPMETIFEQIPEVRKQLLAEADRLVSAVAGPVGGGAAAGTGTAGAGAAGAGAAPPVTVSETASASAQAAVALSIDVDEEVAVALREFYVKEMRPFLEAPARRDHPLALAKSAEGVFRRVRTLLPPPLHDAVADLESIAEEERQLSRQRLLYRWLHVWLVVHIPLSLALLVLGAVHAVMALRY